MPIGSKRLLGAVVKLSLFIQFCAVRALLGPYFFAVYDTLAPRGSSPGPKRVFYLAMPHS